RLHLHAGKPLPEGTIIDAQGRPSTDPRAFYGPPRGAILPFGSQYGYKGFGLALLVELLGGVLAGYATRRSYPHVNGLCLIAIDPEAFCGAQTFKALVEDMRAYVVNTPPMEGFSEVLLPGAVDFRTRERRLREGIPLADESWRLIVEAAGQVGLMV
ncbi:MAG: Ldh family oxidoreductase, partial [Thermoflexales bacterium]|nr:Ldh family oxidoreductase [Thermoflexales bacterium]